MSYLDDIERSLATDDKYATLRTTTRLKDIKDPEMLELLRGLYRPKRALAEPARFKMRLLGTLLNCIFTQKRFVFINTYLGFNEALRKDKNTRLNAVNGSVLKRFNDWLLITGVLEVIEMPRGTPGSYRAGIYKIGHEKFKTILGRIISSDVEQAQLAQCREVIGGNEDLSQSQSQENAKCVSTGEEAEQEAGAEKEAESEAAQAGSGKVQSKSFEQPSQPQPPSKTGTSEHAAPFTLNLDLGPQGPKAAWQDKYDKICKAIHIRTFGKISEDLLEVCAKLNMLENADVDEHFLNERDAKRFREFQRLLADGHPLSPKQRQIIYDRFAVKFK